MYDFSWNRRFDNMTMPNWSCAWRSSTGHLRKVFSILAFIVLWAKSCQLQGDSSPFQDSLWTPNEHDKDLNLHGMYQNMVPVMLRRGISCASIADVFRVIHHSIVTAKEPLTETHRRLTEKEIRATVNSVREQCITSLGQLEFDGKF